MTESERLWAELRALSDRVAKLEVAAVPQHPTAEQAQSDTWASVEKNAAEVRTWPAWKQQVAKAALGAKAEPIAELPAPAVGTLSEVVSDMRNWTTPGTELDRFADRIAAAGAALEARLAQAEKLYCDALRLASSQRELIAQAERDASHHRALWLAEVAAREMAQANAAQAERERDDWKRKAGF